MAVPKKVEAPYQHQEFPKFMFGPGKQSKLVDNADDYETLVNQGWCESPDDVNEDGSVNTDDKDALIEALQEENQQLRQIIADAGIELSDTEPAVEDAGPLVSEGATSNANTLVPQTEPSAPDATVATDPNDVPRAAATGSAVANRKVAAKGTQKTAAATKAKK